MVSSTFLKEAEARVRSDVMKIVTEKTGTMHNIDSIMKTERRLLDLKEEMEAKNHKAVQ
jgi:TusA-related sulfurtransferase